MSRTSEYPIEPLFLDRWSPRAFDGGVILEKDLMTILEAARWAPSSSNIQPWRFVYALRSDDVWDQFVDFLLPGNAVWAHRASALVVLLADTVGREAEEGKPMRVNDYASFDAGAAWAQLALQAHAAGFCTHAMAGIKQDHIREVLKLSDRYKVEIVIALGQKADVSVLPENLQEREVLSGRKAMSEIAFHGQFPA